MASTGAAAENEMPKPILLAAFLLCLTAVSPAAESGGTFTGLYFSGRGDIEYLRLNPAVR